MFSVLNTKFNNLAFSRPSDWLKKKRKKKSSL